MANPLRPVSRDKLAVLCGGNQELIKFFESLFSVVSDAEANGSDVLTLLAGNATAAANQALSDVQAIRDAIDRSPQAASIEQIQSLQEQINALAARPIVDADIESRLQALELVPVRFDPLAGQGWATYIDTTYTIGAPLVLLDGVMTTLPNNAGAKIERYLPADVASFYDSATSKITPKYVGDYNIIAVRLIANPNATFASLKFGIDIGGAPGVIFQEEQAFHKGAGVAQPFVFTCPGYSLDTFIANGGLVKLTAIDADISVYGIEFQISRVSSAKDKS